MPRPNRPTETDSYKPLINFEKTAYEKLSLKLSEPVVMHLKAYAAYVESCVGANPTIDEIVDKGMQRLFDADRGFKNWLQQPNSTATQAEKDQRRCGADGCANAVAHCFRIPRASPSNSFATWTT